MHNLPKPGDLIGRKYQLVELIGAGGMGVVFAAINVATEGRVALKWLHPQLSSSAEAVERFKREAKVTARIQHPNVVAIHDTGEHEGQLYLVMELLRGRSLRELLTRQPMPPARACRMLLPVLRGVAAAHAVGVLHRDLKPENIFFCDSPDGLEPFPKVLDFGIAKLGFESDETALSAQSAVLGTYQYMAPEQLRRERDLSAGVDVYALGVVLYRMLTGELPYAADNPVDLALQVLQSEAPPLRSRTPDVPDALEQVVARALARDPARRFVSVLELALALEPFAEGMRYQGEARGLPARPLEALPRVAAQATPFLPSAAPTAKRRSKLRWLLGGGAVAAACAAAAALGPLPGAAPGSATTYAPAAAPDAPAPQVPTALSSQPVVPVVPDASTVRALAPAPEAATAQPAALEGDSEWQHVPQLPLADTAPSPQVIDIGVPHGRPPRAESAPSASGRVSAARERKAQSKTEPARERRAQSKTEPAQEPQTPWEGRGARVRLEDF